MPPRSSRNWIAKGTGVRPPAILSFLWRSRSGVEIHAVELTADRAFIHFIGLAAMCNHPADHRILGELVAAIAEQFEGVVDFDSIDAPIEELGMKKCPWQ